MGTVIFLLLLLFVAYILWPVFRVWWTLRKARRHAEEFFGAKRPAPDGYAGHRGYTQGMHRRHRRGKIIDPDVGEYVEFEEVAVYSHTTESRQAVHYEEEDQVTDVEWEDL